VTFPTEEQWKKMGEVGFLRRVGMQYHWLNDDYKRYALLNKLQLYYLYMDQNADEFIIMSDE
jgi:predicted N-acyltransferase